MVHPWYCGNIVQRGGVTTPKKPANSRSCNRWREEAISMGETIGSPCWDSLLGHLHLLQCLIHSPFLATHLSISLSPSFQCTGPLNKMLSHVRAGYTLMTRCLVRTTQLPTSLFKRLRTLPGFCSNFESTNPKLVAGVWFDWLKPRYSFCRLSSHGRADALAAPVLGGWDETRGPLPNNKGVPGTARGSISAGERSILADAVQMKEKSLMF